MSQKILVLLLIVSLIIIIILSYLLFMQYNVRGILKRFKNGLRRFVKRMKLLWPMHLFFLIILIAILCFNKYVYKIEIQPYLLSLASLVMTIYFVDFLVSEQDRRISANKVYLIDIEVYQIVSRLSHVLSLILTSDNVDSISKFHQENGTVSYEMNEEEIGMIIIQSSFWDVERKFFINIYESLEVNNKFFLKNEAKNAGKELDIFLMKYSNIILYNEFKLVHNLDYCLKRANNIMEYDINFENDELCGPIFDLIESLRKCESILEKWH